MSNLAGKRALIVEDEPMVSLLVEDMLAEFGCEIVAKEVRLAPALAAATTASLDFAILDVDLAGELTYPVADELARRGVPFLFATGNVGPEHDGRYPGVPTVAKPFAGTTLRDAAEHLFVSSRIAS